MPSIKYINILVFILLFSSCNVSSKKEIQIQTYKRIEDVNIEKSQLILNASKGQWFYKGKPFNGYALKYFRNNDLAEKTGYFNGKREGESFAYYSNGNKKKVAYYSNNKLNGKKMNYYENGTVVTEFNYVDGIPQGVQKTWFPNGQLAKKRILNKGVEEGLQQAWLENGKLYVNYEAKNGRIFGMLRANSCYKLEDEKVVRKD
ncbi:toxin-antitoxin system YwqK family antitoxin [Winogradskyella sp. PE311]|uniref:toxin-antitoxin system YwqK family antitoxin n=1 Tax=Winogradskyella sp. PE311 TaxID=3366943 RepID=UPI003980A240